MSLAPHSNRIVNIKGTNVYRVDFMAKISELLTCKKNVLSKKVLKCFDRLSVAIANTLDIASCLIYIRHEESYLVIASSNVPSEVKAKIPFIGQLRHGADGFTNVDSHSFTNANSFFSGADKIFLIESDRRFDSTSVGILMSSDMDTDQFSLVDIQFCEAILGIIRRIFRFCDNPLDNGNNNIDYNQEAEDIGVLVAFSVRLACQVNKVALYSCLIEQHEYFASCGLESRVAPAGDRMRFLGNQFVDFLKHESGFLEPVLGNELTGEKYLCITPFKPSSPELGYLAVTSTNDVGFTLNELIICKGLLSPLAYVMSLYREHCNGAGCETWQSDKEEN